MLAKYVFRRLLAAIPVLLGVTILTFLVMHATAGNYVPGLAYNPDLKPADIARIKANLGLDRPIWLQYVTWLGGIVHGDFGRSLIDGSPVMSHILERLPNTLELTFTSMLIALVVSIPLGVAGAVKRGTGIDHCFTFLSV